MKNLNFFQLRIPTLPINRILSTNDILENVEKLGEAIYVASPIFQQKSNSNKLPVKKTNYKYLSRNCARSTPFGLFSGVLLGTVGEKTNIVISEFESFAEIDITICQQISEFLKKKEFIRNKIQYYANTSLYEIGNYYRYFEYYIDDNKQRKFGISSVEKDDILVEILTRTKHGCLFYDIQAIFTQNGYSDAEADLFFDELVDSQLLISELDPSVTDIPYLRKVIAILDLMNTNESEYFKNILVEVQMLLQVQEFRIEAYEKVKQIICTHFQMTIETDFLYVNAIYKSSPCQLSKKIFSNLKQQIYSLQPLLKKKDNPRMKAFKKAFYERYEEEEMPLAFVLDNELGIGYGNGVSIGHQGLLDNIIPNEILIRGNKEPNTNWGNWEKFLFRKYKDALLTHKQEIQITDEDLEILNGKGKFSNSFYVLGSLLGASIEELDKGNFTFYLNALGGSSAINLMSRFSSCDEQLHKHLYNTVTEEYIGDKILAEIIYLPEGKAGNIVRHPSIRPYEILLNGTSKSDHTCSSQILIDDLMISIPNGNTIILKSKRLNKEIIPRLSNAHNFTNEIPIYQFFCDLQYQTMEGELSWDWSLLSQEVFLPRVCYKGKFLPNDTLPEIILSKRKWNVTVTNFDNFEKFRMEYNVPHLVQLVEGDNELLLNLELSICHDIIHDKVMQKGSVVLSEFLHTHENCWIHSSEGSFASEIVIPFCSNNDKETIHENIRMNSHRQPFFPIGTSWLYVKIYTGEKTIEQILLQELLQLIDDFKKERIIEKWFFVRYDDGEPHLRLRFYHSSNANFYQDILNRLNIKLKLYLESKIIHTFQVDTYKPEYVRYNNNIEESESVFSADSESVLSLLSLTYNSEELRFYAAILGVDAYMNDIQFNLEEKINFTESVKQAFLVEFGAEKELKRNLDTKYRYLKGNIYDIFEMSKYIQFKDILKKRSDSVRMIIQGVPPTVLQSYIHMFINRLFISQQRTYEMLTYFTLNKYYSSLLAQNKNSLMKLT